MLGGAAAGRRAFAGVNVSPSLTWKAPCRGFAETGRGRGRRTGMPVSRPGAAACPTLHGEDDAHALAEAARVSRRYRARLASDRPYAQAHRPDCRGWRRNSSYIIGETMIFSAYPCQAWSTRMTIARRLPEPGGHRLGRSRPP